MAQWYQTHGSSPELLNISDSIITSQMQEVQQMQAILAVLPMPADCSGAPSSAVCHH